MAVFLSLFFYFLLQSVAPPVVNRMCCTSLKAASAMDAYMASNRPEVQRSETYLHVSLSIILIISSFRDFIMSKFLLRNVAYHEIV